MLLEEQRQQVMRYGRLLIERGLVRGTCGNISVYDRSSGLAAISPSGLDYLETAPGDVVVVDAAGTVVEGARKPSSELPLHVIFYSRRQDINAVVHTHSLHATALACMGLELPPLHYLIGFAGKTVPCAPYATFGTAELAEHAFAAMAGGRAVLLANHGVIAVGSDIAEAFMIAETVEFCAELYCRCRAMGHPQVLPAPEMETVMEKFKDYGKQ